MSRISGGKIDMLDQRRDGLKFFLFSKLDCCWISLVS